MTTRRRTAAGLAGLALVGQLVLIAIANPTLITAAHAASAPAWLQRVNQIRSGSGLSAVTDEKAWTKGIKDHLHYLAKSPAKYQTGQYASAHTENPKSPDYTKAGALEASRSDLAFSTASNLAAINGWLEAPFHTIGMLRPGLTQVAFARDPKTGDAGLDVIGGLQFLTHTTPILFPGPGATINLALYGGELPSPIETCTTDKPKAHYTAPGLPLIALLTQPPASNLSVTVTKPDGKKISSHSNNLCVVDENNYTTTDKIYGSTGREILVNDNAVLIIPRTKLVAGKYTVKINQAKQSAIRWSFRSHPAASPPILSFGTECSRAHKHTGSVTVVIVNPPDGEGTAHYTVTLGSRKQHATAADGEQTQLTFFSVGPGKHTVKVVGSDGSRASTSVRVPTCMAHASTRL